MRYIDCFNHYFPKGLWDKMLATPGGPADAGFIVELERPRDQLEGYEARFGPLFQGEDGDLQFNANLLLQRHYRTETQQRTELARAAPGHGRRGERREEEDRCDERCARAHGAEATAPVRPALPRRRRRRRTA